MRDKRMDTGSGPVMASPVPVASTVVDFCRFAMDRPVEDFAKEYGPYVLVGPAPAENDGDDWSFRTLSLRTVREQVGANEIVFDESYVVYALKKVKPGAFANQILIGRSATNDVCVVHSSVSKLHARVRVQPDGKHLLSDAGSSNGTVHQAARLEDGVEKELTSGDAVQLGGCSFAVLDAIRLHSLLLRFTSAK